MTPGVRHEMVKQLLTVVAVDNVCGEISDEQTRLLADTTREEKLAAAEIARERAVRSLRDAGVLRDVPTLLDLDYREVQRLAIQGYALLYLADQLGPTWATQPETRLVDLLKTQRPEHIARLAQVLQLVGITDLDVWLRPEDER